MPVPGVKGEQRGAQDGWTTLKDAVVESDTKKLEATKDDMDALLVFVSDSSDLQISGV